METIAQLSKGAQFLIKDADITDTFIPEEFSEEQLMIKQTVTTFIEQEIHPLVERIEALEHGVMPQILDNFASLGMLGTHMPEELGGMDLDFITNTLIGEAIGPSGSFSVTYNAHTGIGMLPILYYGTPEQKNKFIPRLISGELKSAYCLTEPSSGSDALSAKTTAVLSTDKQHYILNGQKMWITNGGFADLFTVFAQVDGDKFTAFLVERHSAGLTLGAEEKKLGIKGSSTRQVFFENVNIPVENLLGEIGKGHLIAFNVLNTGRFKLGASCLGGAKKIMSKSYQYALERQQFGQAIFNFGAIQHKLAEQAIQLFVTESVIYRTAHLIQIFEEYHKSQGLGFGMSKLEAAEEFAVECSIIKILGSETLDFVVDEAVQVYGGMGYSEETDIARAYRDSRINRIFEGTNEINRMVIISTILKRALKGELDLMSAGMAIQKDLMENQPITSTFEEPFTAEKQALQGMKNVLIMLLGTAAQMNMAGQFDLKKEQEVLMSLSNIIIDIFAVESTLLRVIKHMDSGNNEKVYSDILQTYTYTSIQNVYTEGQNIIASMIPEAMHNMFLHGLRKYTKYPLINVKAKRRNIAEFYKDYSD